MRNIPSIRERMRKFWSPCIGALFMLADAGTNGDWLRFLWDRYTNVSDTCADCPMKLDMLKLYQQTRLNGGRTNNNYFSKMQAAGGVLNLSDCLKTSRINSYAAYNGGDNE
jgi:hypothetical protein